MESPGYCKPPDHLWSSLPSREDYQDNVLVSETETRQLWYEHSLSGVWARPKGTYSTTTWNQSLLFSCLRRLFLPLARGVRSEFRMAWLIKNCFLLVGDTRLAGELGREMHLRSSIRLWKQADKTVQLTSVHDYISEITAIYTEL